MNILKNVKMKVLTCFFYNWVFQIAAFDKSVRYCMVQISTVRYGNTKHSTTRAATQDGYLQNNNNNGHNKRINRGRYPFIICRPKYILYLLYINLYVCTRVSEPACLRRLRLREFFIPSRLRLLVKENIILEFLKMTTNRLKYL